MMIDNHQILSKLKEFSNKLDEISAINDQAIDDKQKGLDVRRTLDVLDKDTDTLKSMIYSAYILAQNVEDPL